MIIITTIKGKRISARIGAGKLTEPTKITRLEADGREAEVILANAPFLKEHNGNNHYWEGVEASAAAMSFNFTENTIPKANQKG